VPVIPSDLKYGRDHMWARPGADAGLVQVGLTDFAQDPYGQGWMFEIEPDPTTLGTQLGALLDARAYGALTGA